MTMEPTFVEPKAKAKRKSRGRRKVVKKNSAPLETARSEKGPQKRPERVRMGAGGNLEVSPAILADIKSRGCVPRWALDDDKGKMAKYEAAYWEIYRDADGNQVIRPSGGGRRHILVMLDEKLHAEDMKLKRKENNAILADKAKLESGPGYKEYIPEGHEYVIAPDL